VSVRQNSVDILFLLFKFTVVLNCKYHSFDYFSLCNKYVEDLVI